MSSPIQLRWKKLTRANERTRAFRDVIHDKSPSGYHCHDFHEIFLIETGQGIHHINGRDIPLRSGHVAFVRPSDCHSFRSTGRSGLTVLDVSFHPELTPSETANAKRSTSPEVAALFDPTRMTPLMWLPPRNLSVEVSRAFRHFVNGERDDLAAQLFLLTLADLFRHSDNQLTELAPEWLSDAFLCLDIPENLREGVPAVVRTACRSAQHVCKETKKHFGRTLRDIITARRLALAVQMLELGSRNVSEIAAECGYESVSHFVRKFKATFGEPPLRYRNSRRSIV